MSHPVLQVLKGDSSPNLILSTPPRRQRPGYPGRWARLEGFAAHPLVLPPGRPPRQRQIAQGPSTICMHPTPHQQAAPANTSRSTQCLSPRTSCSCKACSVSLAGEQAIHRRHFAQLARPHTPRIPHTHYSTHAGSGYTDAEFVHLILLSLTVPRSVLCLPRSP